MQPAFAAPDENFAGSSSPDVSRDPAAEAERCRRLARTIGDSATVETLSRMAAEYEAQAGAGDRLN